MVLKKLISQLLATFNLDLKLFSKFFFVIFEVYRSLWANELFFTSQPGLCESTVPLFSGNLQGMSLHFFVFAAFFMSLVRLDFCFFCNLKVIEDKVSKSKLLNFSPFSAIFGFFHFCFWTFEGNFFVISLYVTS